MPPIVTRDMGLGSATLIMSYFFDYKVVRISFLLQVDSEIVAYLPIAGFQCSAV